MSDRLKKALLGLLAIALLCGAGQMQQLLNRERQQLGLTRVDPLENAPPVLAFTTVALGGFRGLIANGLWIRANDLQEDDKFFEMAQLSDWITKLEPHYSQVWAFEAWNMAYNISVKFKDFPDRWRWVQRGIELLRDEGLRYNPNDLLLYQQLGLLFQHKMGHFLDDANRYYKQQWAGEMTEVLGKGRPDFDGLINPQTPDARTRAARLRDQYKLDPRIMKRVDEEYGPLEWRLPEAHGIYWAQVGLDHAKENPAKVNQKDVIDLERLIYQSMVQAFYHGRLVLSPFGPAEYAPNLDIIPNLNATYERLMKEDEKNRDIIAVPHRNFLGNAVYFLYAHGRRADALRWYQYLGREYPTKQLLTKNPHSTASQLTLDEYAVARVQEDAGETSPDRIVSAIEGLLMHGYQSLINDEDEEATGYKRLARQVYDRYEAKTTVSTARVGLPPFEAIDRDVLGRFLDPANNLPSEARAVLRTKLRLPADYLVPPSSTNAPASH